MMELSPKWIQAYLEHPLTENDTCSYDINIEGCFEIEPTQFLDFAKDDLTASYGHHHNLNCLSNTKRAIEGQIDSLLIAFGLINKSKKERWSFPKKIEVLTTVGVISPKILNRINKQRNLLEHNYKNPQEPNVEDAVDVAELFLECTMKYLKNGISEFSCSNEDYGNLYLEIENSLCQIIIEITKFEADQIRSIKKNVRAVDDDYLEYLKLFLNGYTRYK
ncbi:MAG: hypothetical protein NWF00_12690 [Candidatus Bathyarchaeota archaeon]|nr:hypothetical protein [Candidatus Bathyarchaeota archaeon]